MGTTPPLSLKLANGRLALLTPSYMRRYFTRRLASWYPGYALHALIIKDQSALRFKKSIAYHLVLTGPGKQRVRQMIRANVPSLDTTPEARVADQAMRAVWRRYEAHGQLHICRPLGFDERLRALFYEDLPGRPLTSLVRSSHPLLRENVRGAARWLASLHRERIPTGRLRSLKRERLEAHYFLLNVGHYHAQSLPRAHRILNAFFVQRQRYAQRIRRGSVLIHGDYNFNNVIVDEATRNVGVIDFGNAWRYDPMSDLANAQVQMALLAWQHGIKPRVRDEVVRTFLSAYRRRSPMGASDMARFKLFLAWWSMQTLSYTLALSFVIKKTPMIRDSLNRAERALGL